MVTKDHIRKLAESHIIGTGIFLVDVRLSSTGRLVEAVTNDGSSVKGTLMNVTRGGFDLRVETKEKKKEVTSVIRSFNYEDVKSVKVIISFK
jgi:hypothetical protein